MTLAARLSHLATLIIAKLPQCPSAIDAKMDELVNVVLVLIIINNLIGLDWFSRSSYPNWANNK